MANFIQQLKNRVLGRLYCYCPAFLNEDDVLGLGQSLAAHNINVLTFNYRGTYRSEGAFSIENSLEDIRAAFDFLQDEKTRAKYRIDPDRLALGGWSYGGGIGLIYASYHPDTYPVFSIAGNDFGAIAREYQSNKAFADMIDQVFAQMRHSDGPVRYAYDLPVRAELLPNQDRYDIVRLAPKLVARNLLLIGGWDDLETPLESEIIPLYRRLKALDAQNVQIRAFTDGHRYENSHAQIVDTLLEWITSS